MNLLKYTLLAIIGFNCLVLKSQTHNDSVTADITKVIQEKNLRFSILGGPGYTPDYGFLIGGAALFTFSMDQQDKNLQRSVMPISFGITFAKPLGFNAMLKPQLFFKKDKIRLLGTYYFKNTNDNYFGIDYDHHKYEIERGDKSIYTSNVIQLNPIVMFRIKETDFFVGPMLDYSHEVVKNPGEAVYYDKLFREQGGDENGLTINSFGVGVTGSYDTRDVAANAYKGVYLELKGTYFGKEIGSDMTYGDVSLDYRQYLALPALGDRRVLAWNVISRNGFGDIPFSRYPKIGNPFDLRGYYQGQYRNKSTLVGVAEYRHMFNFGDETKAQRFWSRFGFAAWGGCGMMGKDIVSYDRFFPNFGAGLRIELQPRMNFRMDVGYSPVDKQTLLYFNMTEAF